MKLYPLPIVRQTAMRRVRIHSLGISLAKQSGIDVYNEHNYWFTVREGRKVHYFEDIDTGTVRRTSDRCLPIVEYL